MDEIQEKIQMDVDPLPLQENMLRIVCKYPFICKQLEKFLWMGNDLFPPGVFRKFIQFLRAKAFLRPPFQMLNN